MDYLEEDVDPIVRAHAIHWLVCNETYNSVSSRKKVIGSRSYWELIYNTDETCIYRLKNARRVIIGFRGTDNQKDLYDDLKITVNEIFPRKLEAISLIRELQAKMQQTANPYLLIELTGHSLGGGIAREAGKELDLMVVTFNAAAPPTAPQINIGVNYHIVYDIISAWQGPFTVRIDKGFRPIPRWWDRFFTATWIYASTADLVESHGLKNFSNERAGRVICGEEETALMNSWLSSLPFPLMMQVYILMFGLSGERGLPDMTGCFTSQSSSYDTSQYRPVRGSVIIDGLASENQVNRGIPSNRGYGLSNTNPMNQVSSAYINLG